MIQELIEPLLCGKPRWSSYTWMQGKSRSNFKTMNTGQPQEKEETRRIIIILIKDHPNLEDIAM
jgi:hypothetical protein